ncbi:GntR family transcriptional regulator [Bradyrhizobium sp. CB3481]|uniref:GntR family transcriptional regulator n=1 Tax=Bradyrhizobium sp. CB3481 TaxID=3039158 RepID=UPI0024B26E95|nr:GntR family transcriptional regulator [Bradyrhizobium sp. CB3481]WFU18144.1 GntR family transcriptional regulator [Bradyrhizobium sp. CB3481]
MPKASKKSNQRKQEPAEAESLTDQAYALLEEMISTLQLAPGTLVSEAELSAQLGIGRTPVREAMQRLARERLLLVLPRRGCIVTPIRPEEEVMLIETRRAIETLVMGRAAERAGQSERRQFGEIATQMKTALRTQDFDAFARLDAEFNRLCIAACRNELAGSMMQVIAPLNRRFWFTHHGRRLSKEGVEAHIEIALALSRGDAKAALAGTERLLRYVESRIGQSVTA